jgi:hypothetical protein
VAQQQQVEILALDVVGHRVPVIQGFREFDRARAAGRRVPEEGSVLFLKAGGTDLLGQAELVEDRQREGEKRLADVEPRELLLLEDDHGASGAGERGRDGRAGGTAADDGRVVELRHWRILERLQFRFVILRAEGPKNLLLNE